MALASETDSLNTSRPVENLKQPASTTGLTCREGSSFAAKLVRRLIVKTWPSFWWWTVVVLSVPFTAYAMVYVLAYEPLIREMSMAKEDGLVLPSNGAYNQGILDHMKLWQLHSLCAIVYIITGPLQFIDRVRLTRVPFHRASGYAFLGAGAVLAATGLAMSPYSEMAPGYVMTSLFLAPTWLFAAGNALWNVRTGRMQAHREWMIRTAAIGFCVMFVRPLTPLLRYCFNSTMYDAALNAMWICLFLSIAGSQAYIELRYHGYGGLVPASKVS